MKLKELDFLEKRSTLSYSQIPVNITINGDNAICFSVDAQTYFMLGKPEYITGAYRGGRLYLKPSEMMHGFKVAVSKSRKRASWRFPPVLVSAYMPIKDLVGGYDMQLDGECGLPYIEIERKLIV